MHSMRFRNSQGSRRSLGWIPFEKPVIEKNTNSFIYFGKYYRFFGSKRRPLPSTTKLPCCFIEDARGRWYVCFYVEAPERKCGENVVGIDLGLESLVAMSSGRKIPAPRYYRKSEEKLKIAQRANNKDRVRAIHAKIRNQRTDFLHKLSKQLVDESKLIAIGNVNSTKLIQTKLSKSITDAGWYTFKQMLKYKCQQAAASFVEVDEKYTSQTCSHCGALPPERPKGIAGLGIRQWECSECGSVHDRDVNAARNILNVALSAQRRVDESPLSRDKHDNDNLTNL